MKRTWIALLLALSLVLAFTACQPDGETPDTPSDTQSQTPEEALDSQTPDESQDNPTHESTDDSADLSTDDPAEDPDADAAADPEQDPDADPTDDPDYVPDISGTGASDGEAWYYASFSESGTYTDDLGNEYAYDYAYPAFADAEDLNAEIEAFCQPYIDEMHQAMDSGYSLDVLSIRYETGSCGSIRSVLVSVAFDADVTRYQTFNYNEALGQEATPAQVLEAACIDEETLTADALSAAAEKFISLYGSISDGEFYDEQLAMTLSPDAYGKHMPLFFREDGTLWFVARIYSLAGAAYYDYPLPLA